LNKIITTIIIFLCLSIKVYPAEINFSYIDNCKTNINGAYVWTENEKYISTKDISNLCLLFEASKQKDIYKQSDFTHTINLLVKLYDGNGEFYKGLKKDGSIDEANADALTNSYAFWALAKAINSSEGDMFFRIDEILKDIINKKLELKNYGQFKTTFGIKTPMWFVDSNSGLTSIYVLGLIDYYSKSKNQKVKDLIKAYCEGMSIFSDNSLYDFPYCAHYESASNPNIWTLSHNRQMAALALSGKLLANENFISSAEKEADNLYAHLLTSYGAISGLAPSPVIFPQTPESANVMTENLTALAGVTKKEIYYIFAGISASWFYGGNTLYTKMYMPETGKCYEELTENGRTNKISLDASISALKTLISIYKTPAWSYRLFGQKTPAHCFIILQMEDGKAVRKDYETLPIEYPNGTEGKLVAIKKENSFWLKFDITEQSDYSFHLAYLKQFGYSTGTSILMRIDGDKIYSVPLGGSTDEAYMMIQEVLEPRELLPGVHSMGVKFSGLLLGKPATLDSIILKSLFQRRILEHSSGKKIAIIKSFYNTPKSFMLENLSQNKMKPLHIIERNGNKREIPEKSIKIPEYGYIIIEGIGIQ